MTPKEYLEALSKGKEDSSKNETDLVIDSSASIWITPYGFYWLDEDQGAFSGEFFKTSEDAFDDFIFELGIYTKKKWAELKLVLPTTNTKIKGRSS